MKKIYALLFVSLLLFIGYSCEDGSLSHGDVYIPDPVEESDEDDGFATEPTTTSVVRMSIGEGHQHQMIDGFGCGFAEWSHRIWNNNHRDAVMADLFGDNGLKLNIFRGEVFPHYQDDVTGEIEFGMDRNFNLPADEPKYMNNYWFKYHGAECAEQVQLGQMWLVDYLSRKHKSMKYMFSVWSPPKKWKDKDSNSGGSLKAIHYEDYANYLIDFVKEYEKKFGINIYGLSPTNEPDNTFTAWSTCKWTPEQLADFSHNTFRKSLDAAGYNDKKIIMGECSSWWKASYSSFLTASNQFFKKCLESEASLANDNVIAAGHGYSMSNLDNILPFDEAVNANIPVWMTENCDNLKRSEDWNDAMKWARNFHYYLAQANVNAYIWWAGARPCSTTGENLIQLEEAIPGTTYYRVPRYYTYGQFTRFIEAGSHRVDVEAIPSEENQFPAELLMSAYVKDNTYTIVLVNSAEKESFSTLVEIEGKSFQNMIAYTSSEDVKWQRKKFNPSLSGLRSITVPKLSVVTVTGKIKDIAAE